MSEGTPDGKDREQQHQVAESRWRLEIGAVKSQRAAVEAAYLEHCWDQGALIARLLEEPKVYGNRAVADVAKELGVQPQMAWACHALWRLAARWAIRGLVENGLDWQVVKMLSCIPDPERKQYLDALAAGRATPNQIENAYQKHKKAKENASRPPSHPTVCVGGRGIRNQFRNTRGSIQETQAKLLEFQVALRNHKLSADGTFKAESETQVPGLIECIERLRAACDRALDYSRLLGYGPETVADADHEARTPVKE